MAQVELVVVEVVDQTQLQGAQEQLDQRTQVVAQAEDPEEIVMVHMVMVPLVVTGPPLKVRPVLPPLTSTLVTVPLPLPVPLLAAVILPWASTVMSALV